MCRHHCQCCARLVVQKLWCQGCVLRIPAALLEVMLFEAGLVQLRTSWLTLLDQGQLSSRLLAQKLQNTLIICCLHAAIGQHGSD